MSPIFSSLGVVTELMTASNSLSSQILIPPSVVDQLCATTFFTRLSLIYRYAQTGHNINIMLVYVQGYILSPYGCVCFFEILLFEIFILPKTLEYIPSSGKPQFLPSSCLNSLTTSSPSRLGSCSSSRLLRSSFSTAVRALSSSLVPG